MSSVLREGCPNAHWNARHALTLNALCKSQSKWPKRFPWLKSSGNQQLLQSELSAWCWQPGNGPTTKFISCSKPYNHTSRVHHNLPNISAQLHIPTNQTFPVVILIKCIQCYSKKNLIYTCQNMVKFMVIFSPSSSYVQSI